MTPDKTQQGHVKSVTYAGVATIEFYHPSHNSLPGRLLAELEAAILDAGKDNDVRVLVLKSAGDRTFCAGASFDELKAIDNPANGKRFFMGFARVINAIRNCGKIVVGRVQGKAVGGGVGLASAVDYCLATQYASVKLSELAIGIGPFVIGPAVARKVGLSAFSQMALDATGWYAPAYAKEKGLYAEVFDDAAAMDERLTAFTRELAGRSAEALAELKRVFWAGTDHWDTLLAERAATSGSLILGEEARAVLANL